MADPKSVAASKEEVSFISKLNIPEGSLSLAAAGLGIIGVAIHAGAWSEFFSNLATMKENVQNPQG